jgi:hypothetical protein
MQAAPTANHAAEIKNCPPPQDIKQLQRAQILKPLTDLLKGGAKTLEWTISAQVAFQNAKRLLAAAVPLQHPAPNAELSLATDASDTQIRGVMQKNQATIGDHLVFSPANSQTRNHVIPLLIVNY